MFDHSGKKNESTDRFEILQGNWGYIKLKKNLKTLAFL